MAPNSGRVCALEIKSYLFILTRNGAERIGTLFLVSAPGFVRLHKC